MGSINGTQRKLLDCSIKLENVLSDLKQQNKQTLKQISAITIPQRSRSNSDHSSVNTSTPSTSDKLHEV